MKSLDQRIKTSNIKIQTLMLISEIIVVLMLLVFCTFNIVNLFNTLTTKEMAVYSDLLQSQTDLIESDIGSATNSLINYSLDNYHMNLLNKLTEGSDYNYNRILLRSELGNIIASSSYVNGVFVYDKKNNIVISSKDGKTDYIEELEVKQRIKNNYLMFSQAMMYRGLDTDDGGCYYCFATPTDVGVIGLWVNMDYIKDFLESANYPLSSIEVTSYNTSAIISGDKRTDLSVHTTGKYSGMDYYVYLSRHEIRKTVIHLMIWEIIFAAVVLIAIVSILSFLLYKTISPLKYMQTQLKTIEEGNENTRLSRKSDLYDYQKLYESFNNMMDHIFALNSELLVEQKEKNQIYSSYLALQLNPHFYVSYLNIIGGLARVRNYGLIQKVTEYLSVYLRYMFGTESTFVTIEEELNHIRNYINIQAIRYAVTIGYNENVDPEAARVRVPKLLLFTFVENSVKYSRTDIEKLAISLKAERNEGKLFIHISDNGHGYPEDILKLINSNEHIYKDDGEHIGIRNLKERIQDIYGINDCITCSNDNGARIDIDIPIIDNIDQTPNKLTIIGG